MSDRLAVIVGREEISYDRLEANVQAAVHWLQPVVNKPGQWFGVALQDDYQHWVVTLALLRLGQACATVYDVMGLQPSLKERFSHWVVDTPLSEDTRCLKPPPELWQVTVPNYAEAQRQESSRPKEGEFALGLAPGAKRLILTSGTTGVPKVVGFEVEHIKARLGVVSKQYDKVLNASARFLSFMGIDTVSGFFLELLTWLKGGVVLFGVPSGQRNIKTEFPIFSSNVITAAPSRLNELLTQISTSWPGKGNRVVLVAGSRLHSGVRDRVLRQIGGQVLTTYGSTELGAVASCDAQLLDTHPGAAGYLNPGVQVQIVDEEGALLPHGQVGRIRCKTQGMVYGYEGESSSVQFQNGWFYPGDLGVLGADGLLVVAGRDTDVVNFGGLKLSAVDMETKLHHIAGLKDVCIVQVDDQGVQKMAIAVVHDDTVQLEWLRQQIVKILGLNVPFHLVRVPGLPRNAMGKLPRSVIAGGLKEVLSRASAR